MTSSEVVEPYPIEVPYSTWELAATLVLQVMVAVVSVVLVELTLVMVKGGGGVCGEVPVDAQPQIIVASQALPNNIGIFKNLLLSVPIPLMAVVDLATTLSLLINTTCRHWSVG